MNATEILRKLSSFWFLDRWHPEVALRYLPLIEEIKKITGEPKIVDVGSGGLGIAPYLNRVVTGVDLNFSPPFHPLLKRVKGSVLSLPFADASFDVVVCVDMLEHLEEDKRQRAIFEMMRVAGKKLLLGVPCGADALRQDKKLDEEYRKRYKRRFVFLEEQLEYGFPQKREIIKAIRHASVVTKKKIDIRIYRNENLTLRYFLMKGWMSRSPFVNVFFRKIMLLAIPIMKHLNAEPCYRQLFFVDINC